MPQPDGASQTGPASGRPVEGGELGWAGQGRGVVVKGEKGSKVGNNAERGFCQQ